MIEYTLDQQSSDPNATFQQIVINIVTKKTALSLTETSTAL